MDDPVTWVNLLSNALRETIIVVLFLANIAQYRRGEERSKTYTESVVLLLKEARESQVEGTAETRLMRSAVETSTEVSRQNMELNRRVEDQLRRIER